MEFVVGRVALGNFLLSIFLYQYHSTYAVTVEADSVVTRYT
jgi:hypothetical protein